MEEFGCFGGFHDFGGLREVLVFYGGVLVVHGEFWWFMGGFGDSWLCFLLEKALFFVRRLCSLLGGFVLC